MRARAPAALWGAVAAFTALAFRGGLASTLSRAALSPAATPGALALSLADPPGALARTLSKKHPHRCPRR